MAGLFSIFRSQFPFSYLLHHSANLGLLPGDVCVTFQALEATSQLDSGAIMLGFIAGSLGITFTNGGIGTYPLLVGLVVAFYIGDTHPEGQAVGNALGMLIWTSQTILMILLGLLSLVLLPRNYSKEAENEPSELSGE
jgi:glycosyltransferase 2 family protein